VNTFDTCENHISFTAPQGKSVYVEQIVSSLLIPYYQLCAENVLSRGYFKN